MDAFVTMECIQSSQAFPGLLSPQLLLRGQFPLSYNPWAVLLGTHTLQRGDFSLAQRSPDKLSYLDRLP